MKSPVDAVELTRKLVGFNTVNPPGSENACAAYLAELLAESGFVVSQHEFAPGRTSLLARFGGDGKRLPLCFAGHIDTVPLGLNKWSVDPFAGIVKDGKLYGRGSSDMKGGVAAFVAAAVQLVQSEGCPDLLLAILAGEETGCQGSFHLAAQPGLLGKAGAVVIAEPTSNYPLVGHKGALWLQGKTVGITAHGSMPERGVNAIYKAARAISSLEGYRFTETPHAVLGQPTLNVGTITGGLNINSVPDGTTFGIDIRTIPAQNHTQIIDSLNTVLGQDVQLATLLDVPALWTEPDTPWIQEVYAVMAPIIKERPVVRTTTYFTDASALTPAFGNAPTIILGPGEASMAHQTDEYCYLERIQQAVEAYTEIARRWL